MEEIIFILKAQDYYDARKPLRLGSLASLREINKSVVAAKNCGRRNFDWCVRWNKHRPRLIEGRYSGRRPSASE
jgi:hypothetical protein